jgi:hypothetical protein
MDSSTKNASPPVSIARMAKAHFHGRVRLADGDFW